MIYFFISNLRIDQPDTKKPDTKKRDVAYDLFQSFVSLAAGHYPFIPKARFQIYRFRSIMSLCSGLQAHLVSWLGSS
jgi:hypothetical protein